jgi:hypothetical protein
MKDTRRDEAIKHLHAMLKETVQAEELVSTGQAIHAMQALFRARRLGKQSIAALLGGCLSAAESRADQASLSRLAELIGFAQQALCPACRSEVGKKWKEAKDV